METALNEITLVLFTTIAPAGVMGYLTMALAIVLSRDEERAAVLRHLEQQQTDGAGKTNDETTAE